MRNLLALGIIAIAALTVIGCGDDESTNPIDINPYFELKTGDTFTYARYDRDPANQRIESSKSIHKWVVIQTGISYMGKNGATRVLQINYDATGAAETGRDTVYLHSVISGEVSVFNVVGNVIRRIPIAAILADSIEAKWYQVADVKTSSAKNWDPIFGASQLNATATVMGFPVTATVKARASHKGKVATTVEGTSYPNNFHTDHAISAVAVALGSEMLNDTLSLSYDAHIDKGILREALHSDSVMVNGQWTPVPGFEMVLIGTNRK